MDGTPFHTPSSGTPHASCSSAAKGLVLRASTARGSRIAAAAHRSNALNLMLVPIAVASCAATRASRKRRARLAVVQTGDMAESGVVREFHLEEGWGVIDGPTVPGGC
jgi:hypothetical protein